MFFKKEEGDGDIKYLILTLVFTQRASKNLQFSSKTLFTFFTR